MKRISVVQRQDADKVNELRVSEYAKNRDFSIDPKKLHWSRADDQGVVLGAWDGDKLVSTMRVELLYDQKLIETKLETPWQFPVKLELPAMITARGATLSDYRGSGLHAALRHWSIVLAVQWGARLALGTTVTTTPGLGTQLKMGYEFFKTPEQWNKEKFYKPGTDAIVRVLNLDYKAQQAIDVSRALAWLTYVEYPWHGQFPEPGIVTLVA